MNKTHVRNEITDRAKIAPSVLEWVDGRRTWDENDICPQERLHKAERLLPAQYSPTSVLLRKEVGTEQLLRDQEPYKFHGGPG